MKIIMKTCYDCIPCLVRQALDAARLATSDEKIQEQILRGALLEMADMDLGQSPPVMAQGIHRIIRELSFCADPFLEQKERFNRFALELYPGLKERVQASSNPLETAIRLAIAGNIIDFGVNGGVDRELLLKTIDHALEEEIHGDVDALITALNSAENILYLGDNTGEIVFDRLLIELLDTEKVTFAVRGGPVINDATFADAEATGMTDLVRVVDNGFDAPGTVLHKCSKEFQDLFAEADLIISKGQGNYETLSDVDKKIFFLLKAKCAMVASNIGCETGSVVIATK